jgi:flagellar hook-length control protein FliK
VHVPTAVAATVNSTPVAAATPPPTPFAQAQPDMANILAQLRGRTDGTYQLRAQVHPAELGAVAITATVHHGALSLTLTPDQAAQQAISQSLPQLRQHLADQGFTGVNVGLGSPHQSGHEGQGDGDRQARAQGSDHSVRHGKDTAVGAVDHPSIVRTGGTLSALDLML